MGETVRSFFKWIWDALQWVFAVYFIILGIVEMYNNWEFYPWFIVMTFGLVWFLRNISDYYAEKVIEAYKDLAALWEESAERMFKAYKECNATLRDSYIEIERLKKKQREWN